MIGPRLRRGVALHPRSVAIALLALTFAVSLLVPPWSDESVGDLGVRMVYAERVLDGQLPYTDFFFEYPPLAAPAIALAGVFGTDEETYRLGIAAVSLLASAAVLLLAGSLAGRTGGSRLAAMTVVALSPLLLGAVVRLHFDPVAVALTLAALVALLARRPALGLSLVGLGAMTKGFPIVVAPVALTWLWIQGDRRGAARGAVGLGVTLAVIAGLWLATSPQGAIDSVTYHLDRPIQVESSPATVLLVAGALGLEEPSDVASHGSAGLTHWLDGPVEVASAVALLGTVLALSLLGGRPGPTRRRERRRQPGSDSGRSLVLASLAAVATFAALGKVLSPQFLTWVVPLLALAVAWRMRLLAALSAAACLLTLAEFPSRYLDLLRDDPLAVSITAVRNGALVGAVVVALAVLRGATERAVPASTMGVTAEARAPARSIERARPAQPR